jgi:type II secretory pathway component GspD/PulD (secretin)
MKNFIRDDIRFNRYMISLGFLLLIYIQAFIFSFIIIHSTQSTGLCEEKTVIFKIQFRDASELLPIIRDMISREGKVSADIRTNSIILSDNAESIEYIRDFIDRLDKPLKQIKIRVKVQELSSADNSSMRARGRISGRNWEAKTHEQKQGGVHVQMDSRSSTGNQASEFFINIQSGSAAYIMVGKEILFTDTWDSLLREYTDYTGDVTYKTIESGLEIRPIIMGDYVDIEITPRISHRVKKYEREIIRFAEMSTYLSVNVGQWITIGGISNVGNEVMREILGIGIGKQSSSYIVSLMVEAM